MNVFGMTDEQLADYLELIYKEAQRRVRRDKTKRWYAEVYDDEEPATGAFEKEEEARQTVESHCEKLYKGDWHIQEGPSEHIHHYVSQSSNEPIARIIYYPHVLEDFVKETATRRKNS